MELIPARFKVGDRVRITRHVHPFENWMLPPSFDVEEGSIGVIVHVIPYYNYEADYDVEFDGIDGGDVISQPYLTLITEEE